MSITKITDPSAVPAAVADYEAQNIHLDRLLGDAVAPYPVSGSNVVKGALFNIGGDMFYCGADTAISGTPSDYVKLVVSGSNAVPSFVASLSGVTWNSAYNGYYSGSDLYLFDEVKAVLAGAISGYKTAMGAMWMLNAGQSLKSTDDVTFNDLDVTGDVVSDTLTVAKGFVATSLIFTVADTQNDLYDALAPYYPGGLSPSIEYKINGFFDTTPILGLDHNLASGGIMSLFIAAGNSKQISNGSSTNLTGTYRIYVP